MKFCQKIYFLFILCGLSPISAFSENGNTADLKDYEQVYDLTKIYLLIGNLTFGHQADSISPLKVEAGINLAAILSKKYSLIPSQIRDSLANYFSSNGIKPQVNIIADTLKADKILFINVSAIQNMLRMEITSADAKPPYDKNTGEGYALMHFIEKDNKHLYDPAILAAAQRALASAERDSNLYKDEEGNFRVFPAETMVIGGIEYKDNPNQFPRWDIFDNQVISSYDAVESIFEEAKNSEKFVVYDIPTRDTIFSIFNMFIPENYRPPSTPEIEALDKFQVKNYICGTLTKLKEHCNLELSLYKIVNGKLKLIRTEKDIVEKDDITIYRKVLKRLTKKLSS